MLGSTSTTTARSSTTRWSDYCRDNKIELTRCRAYKKNDQAWIEQKNGAVVRRMVGYGRLEGAQTAAVLNELYASARLFVNFFQPSFKLLSKTREGCEGNQEVPPVQQHRVNVSWNGRMFQTSVRSNSGRRWQHWTRCDC